MKKRDIVLLILATILVIGMLIYQYLYAETVGGVPVIRTATTETVQIETTAGMWYDYPPQRQIKLNQKTHLSIAWWVFWAWYYNSQMVSIIFLKLALVNYLLLWYHTYRIKYCKSKKRISHLWCKFGRI